MMKAHPLAEELGVPSLEWFKDKAVLNNLAQRTLTLVLTTVLARLLTLGDYGLVGIGILVVFLVSMIQQTGFSHALIRLTRSEPLTKLIVMIIAAGQVPQAFQAIRLNFQSQVLARLASTAAIPGLSFLSGVKLALVWAGDSRIFLRNGIL
jgi:hypothetical protein